MLRISSLHSRQHRLASFSTILTTLVSIAGILGCGSSTGETMANASAALVRGCASGASLVCDDPPDPSDFPAPPKGKRPAPICRCVPDSPPPRPAPPPPGNPHHYLPLDQTHDVVTTLNQWRPQSTTPSSLNCGPFGTNADGSESIQCVAPGARQVFSADLGSGVDVASVQEVLFDAINASNLAIRFFMFDPAVPAGSPFLHLTGFVDMSTDVTVTATVNIGFATDSGIGELPAGGLILALQTQDDASNWNDVATTPAPHTHPSVGTEELIALTVAATITANTGVRAELRQGATWKGIPTIKSGLLLVPECVPDLTKPGTCLP